MPCSFIIHELKNNISSFNLLITDFAVQVVILFKDIGGTSYKIINKGCEVRRFKI